jgi:hypothetical protein
MVRVRRSGVGSGVELARSLLSLSEAIKAEERLVEKLYEPRERGGLCAEAIRLLREVRGETGGDDGAGGDDEPERIDAVAADGEDGRLNEAGKIPCDRYIGPRERGGLCAEAI